MTTRAEVVTWARETLGTPYQHQQRVNGMAMDCAGVPAYVAVKLGMVFDDVTNYGRMPNPAEMRAALDKNLARVAKSAMQPGDLVWMRIDQEPQHLGVLGDYKYGGLSLIHATNGIGRDQVVEHRLDDVWLTRIVAAWSFPGVE